MNPLLRSLFLALSGVALLASGCGGQDDDQASATRLDIGAVVRAAEADKTATTKATIRVEGMGLGKPLTLTGAGTSSLTEVSMDLKFDGAPVFERAGIPADGPIRVVWIGTRMYLEGPEPLRQQIPGDRSWVGLDLAKATGTEDEAFRAIMRIDLAGSLAPFDGGAPLDEVGGEEVEGVATRHWRGRISVDDYLDTLPSGQGEKLRKDLQGGTTPLTDSDLRRRHPLDLWIDDEMRVRRAQSITTLSATKDMPAGKVTFRFDYADFGKPGAVIPPADDLVWDATDALAEASSAQAAAAG